MTINRTSVRLGKSFFLNDERGRSRLFPEKSNRNGFDQRFRITKALDLLSVSLEEILEKEDEEMGTNNGRRVSSPII